MARLRKRNCHVKSAHFIILLVTIKYCKIKRKKLHKPFRLLPTFQHSDKIPLHFLQLVLRDDHQKEHLKKTMRKYILDTVYTVIRMPDTASWKHVYLKIYIMCFCPYKPFSTHGLLSLTANLFNSSLATTFLCGHKSVDA